MQYIRTERDYKKILQIALLSVGLSLLCFLFYYTWVTFYNPYIRLPFYRRGNYMFTIMYGAILTLCVISMKGQYIGEAFLREIVLSQTISVFLTAAIVYFPMSLLQYELLRALPLIILILVQCVVIVAWNFLANRIYFRIVPPLQMLRIADRKETKMLSEKLNRIPHRYRVVETVYAEQGKEEILKNSAAMMLSC